MLYIYFVLVFLERVMPLLPPQRKRLWFVRVAVVNRRDVLNKRTAVALSTAGWPDKTIRAIESKQPDRFKASAAPLSRHLKRQEGRSRLDSKPYSVARICAHLPRVTYSKTAYEMPTACTFLQHIYILYTVKTFFSCMKGSDDILHLSKCATNTVICHLLFSLRLFRPRFLSSVKHQDVAYRLTCYY